MQNRHTSKTNKKKYRTFSPFKTLVASGLGLIGVGAILLLTFFVSTDSLQQQQDVRSDASIPQGSVSISQTHTPQVPLLNQPNAFNLKIKTGTTKLEEITLWFDVISSIGSEITIQESSPLLTYSIEKTNVEHGYKVKVTATPKDANGYFTGTSEANLIKIDYTPTKAGSIALNFDRDNSRAIVFGSSPKQDQLTHLPIFSVFVAGGTSPTSIPEPEDYSLLKDNIDATFKFYETSGSQNEVDKQQLVKDRTYVVRHDARVQNINEDPLRIDPVIITELKINNDETVTRTFKHGDLTKSTGPLTLRFEKAFKAKEVNTFAVTVDSTNVLNELNEGNNIVSASYSSSSTAKACDAVCTDNSQCADNHRCYDTGSDKRCRLTTNVTSNSCSHPTAAKNTCNQYCADTTECASGYTCWNNFCRNPYNVESTSCVNPSTRQFELIRENCGKTCSANRDCANNMRCFNGSCRLATNPSSTSCSAATEEVSSASKGGIISQAPVATAQPAATARPAATLRPTATPRATIIPSPDASASAIPAPIATIEPTPLPTADPTPQPEPAPEESALDAFFGKATNFFNSMLSSANSLTSGTLIPLVVIGVGILLLIIALFIVLKPRKRAHVMETTPTATPTSTLTTANHPKVELHAKPNPSPPPIPGHGIIQPKKSVIPTFGGQSISAPAIQKPDVIELPPVPKASPADIPVPRPPLPPAAAPTQTATLTPATQPQPSMMDRLREKGVTIPERKPFTPPSAPAATEPTATPTGDSQPPVSGWPDDEVVK